MFSKTHSLHSEDDIVISGISGRFPNARNMHEFERKLYNKIDMVDDLETRWRHTNSDLPKRSGKVSDINKFDNKFFGISNKQSETFDPQMRMLLEHVHEAIIDAGLNPKDLHGTKTGVFIGVCFSECEGTWLYVTPTEKGIGLLGSMRSFLAQRISYHFGLTGPSQITDTACSSSMYALDRAVEAIKNGECDAAIVGGSNLLLNQYVSYQFAKLGVLASSGYCRPFDKNASGYTRSEAVAVILLEKMKDAKRAYNKVVYTKTNCDGYKEYGITYPSGEIQGKLLTEFYADLNMDPTTVSYVEAHSTGTLVGDPEECNALDGVFCTGRANPMPVGSVKSNTGHTEASAGVVSIAKVLLILRNGSIPPNINYDSVREGVTSLEEGRLKVVSEVTPLDGSYVGINSFGFGGANAHALLKKYDYLKVDNGQPKDSIPRLVLWSGRTLEAVHLLLDDIESRSVDVEHIALLHNIQKDPIPLNIFRGFGIYGHSEKSIATRLVREVVSYSGVKRPIVWIFSGLWPEWEKIGSSLFSLPAFRSSIEHSHYILAQKGIDLINSLVSKDTENNHTYHSFYNATAIQIAIVDTLKALEIDPDFLVGHSIGELACAYADGCLTAEQAILCAHAVAEIAMKGELKASPLVEVGMGYRKLRSIKPAGVEIVHHNGRDSCTVTGSTQPLAMFISDMNKRKIPIMHISNSNSIYHSKQAAALESQLFGHLEKIIPNPIARSSKWMVHTNLKKLQYCSSAYLTKCFLKPVLFEDTIAALPSKAIVMELAASEQLQTSLIASIPGGVHINLSARDCDNNLVYFLDALGRLFNEGMNFNIANLYPEVRFPVSATTPMIAPFIKWCHDDDWFVTSPSNTNLTSNGEIKVEKISLKVADFQYLEGHCIDGRVLFPATGYLFLVWDLLASLLSSYYFELPVEFEDVKFLRATALSRSTDVSFYIYFQRGTGHFEIVEGSSAIVTGRIKVLEEPLSDMSKPPANDLPILESKDFYKELRLRGYHYSGEFRSVVRARSDAVMGEVKWNNNWIPFMDCLLQMLIIGKDIRSLMLPVGISKLKIDPYQHGIMAQELMNKTGDQVFDVYASPENNMLRCGGIEIRNAITSTVARRKAPGIAVTESYQFIPHLPTPNIGVANAIRMCLQLALENHPIPQIKATEIDSEGRSPLIKYFQDAVEDLPIITADLTYLTKRTDVDLPNVTIRNESLSPTADCLFVIISEGATNSNQLSATSDGLIDNGFLIIRKHGVIDCSDLLSPPGFQLVCVMPVEDETLVLLQNRKQKFLGNTSVVVIAKDDQTYDWVDEVKRAVGSGQVILVAQNDEHSGLIGLVNCLRKEPNGQNVNCVFIADNTAPKFSLSDNFYRDQLSLGLAINVYKNGCWGTYRHLQLIGEYECTPYRDHSYVNALTPGDLSSLKWLKGSFNVEQNEKIVKVVYASLNFRDVMLATGRISSDIFGSNRVDRECVLGLEYSGYSFDGKRLMGMVEAGALGTHVAYDDLLAWECPDDWTLEEAATVPVVYGTVYASFFCSTQISAGKSILIHAGSGGVGLAAIRVALAYGMKVYTTVSTEEKKQFLLDTFPGLERANIGNSRSTLFENMIMLLTEGRGVDFVLNSLSDDKLLASVRCLGRGGVFLEIGKFDMANDTKLQLTDFAEGKTFAAVLVDNYFKASKEQRIKLKELVQRDIANGIIKPLTSKVYPAAEVEQAFRYLASGKHVGKVLLKIRDNEDDDVSFPIAVQPRVYCKPELSYIIPGGLGGFGLELADWLILRGCRKIVLSSSRGISKAYQAHRIRTWEQYGVKILVNTSDITTRKGCENLINEAMTLGPVGGIFNLAVVLKDGIFENQNAETFSECMAPKATATKYLDEITRQMCPHLQYFVIFSSVSCGRGNAGQTNYGMANSVMERIMERRHADGLPGKAIQWGAIGEVGLVADMKENKLDLEIGGTLQQRISSCLFELDLLLSSIEPIVSSMVVAEKRTASGDINIIETVMNIMSMRDLKSISMDSTLAELGMDSLMAVEIKQTLERDFDLVLSPQELRSLTFTKLQTYSENMTASKGDIRSEEGNGLDILLRQLGDEKDSDQNVILLNHVNANGNLNPVFISPGIEGVAGALWRNITADVTYPSYMLQMNSLPKSSPIGDIAELTAKRIMDLIPNNITKFNLVGYSFGSLITLETARLLEESGMTGNVLLIDGSPKFLKEFSLSRFPTNYDEELLQIAVITGLLKALMVNNADELIRLILPLKTFDEKIAKLIELSDGQEYSAKYLMKTSSLLYERIHLILNLDLSTFRPIKSPILLLRPSDAALAEIEEDYGLSSLTENTFTLKFIEGNHSSMLESPILPGLINSFIEMNLA